MIDWVEIYIKLFIPASTIRKYFLLVFLVRIILVIKIPLSATNDLPGSKQISYFLFLSI